MSKQPTKKGPNQVETTGHVWDGVEELNNPLPRWWVWVFYLTIIWGIGYMIAYPAWPMVTRATAGVLGYSTRAEVANDIAAWNERNAALNDQLATIELASIADDQELHGYAINKGGAVFLAHCSQCHGSGAGGVQAAGYPNLVDNDWLWGGTIDDIAYTVAHGIRNEQSPDTRWSEMTAFKDILLPEEIDAVVDHVLAISGQEHDTELAAIGAELYLDNCASCHGDTGEGNALLGAPTLNDAIWLYGGNRDAIRHTVEYARFGVMPAWSEEWRPAGGLTTAEINAVAAYVHQLGGGE
jgi:cytochrome c oxidase cbb3-type subunit 3